MNMAAPLHEHSTYDLSHLSHVFQPIFSIQKNYLQGFECLIRSTRVANPELLFTIAKQEDKLYELDMFSISRGLQTFNEFQHSTIVPLELSINIFPSTLLDERFFWTLATVMNSIQLVPGQVVFEINEAEALFDLSKLKKATQSLQREGFKIALDDLGKGQSSLRTAIELEPDIVKVDRFFCQNIDQSPKKQRLLKWLLCYFKDEGIKVTVEGIENASELSIIQQMNVHYGQGYYLGRPEPLAR